MKTRYLPVVILLAALIPLAAEEPVTNGLGMEFVLIQPGTMQVGVYDPFCPEPGTSAALAGAGLGAAGRAGGASGRSQGAPGASGAAPGVGRTSQPPQAVWTDADYATCRARAKQDASPGFPVTLTKPYYLGKFEVTQGQWKKVMGNNPSTFQRDKVKGDADKHPVETVTWQDAQAFIAKLNKMEKKNLYRLPSEFEWEYAGRAGGPGQVSRAESMAMAVISAPGQGPPQTTEMVGSKKPNPWGLYDMLGNVWEWVADYDNEKMFADPVPAKKGKEHVLKGCGFGAADTKNCIYATHGAGPADVYDVGFRVLRDVR